MSYEFWILSRFVLWCRVLLIHRYGKVSFAAIVATPFMRSITSFAVRQHRFPNANENDICAFGAKWCSSLRSEIRPYGSRSPWSRCGSVSRGSDDALCRHSLPLVRFATLLGKAEYRFQKVLRNSRYFQGRRDAVPYKKPKMRAKHTDGRLWCKAYRKYSSAEQSIG